MNQRTSRISLVIAAAALLTAGGTLAGSPDRQGSWRMGPPGAEQQLARLSQELDLTPDQSRQMLQLLQAAEDEHEALRARFFEQAGPELCAIRQSTEAEIVALLTPEQAEQFQLLREEGALRRDRHRNRAGDFPDCPGDDG
jgi:Spy/CpxP family protein refolding chaperone